MVYKYNCAKIKIKEHLTVIKMEISPTSNKMIRKHPEDATIYSTLLNTGSKI